MLWYPVGWTGGVSCSSSSWPRRCAAGRYTLADFAEFRLESRVVRRFSSVLVVGIGWLYLMPQFQGAGLSWARWPDQRWVGGVLVAVVVLVNVMSGGMRSITFVQAFQYWLSHRACSCR
jgi:Na+(H+)/acetate symporter ActP